MIVGFGLMVVLSATGEEDSPQRLEDAQRGMAEASWPKKPDNRLSPLSGKMKEMSKISPRHYGQEKEFRATMAEGWQKESRTGQRPGWQASAGKNWEEARWNQTRDFVSEESRNDRFQPGNELVSEPLLTFREMERESAAGWSSRSARVASATEGSLRMYEGRLTRVRNQVWQEEKQGVRDLGPGRQEKFSPQEVEKMLSRPMGEPRGPAKAQSPAASPLAAAGN